MDRFATEELCQRMRQFRLETQHSIYLLVDSSAHEQLPRALFERAQDLAYQVLPAEWDVSALPELPFLVALDGDSPQSDVLFDWFLDQGVRANAFMVMASPFDLLTVTDHWRHLLHAQLPDGEILHFRLFDVRIARRFLEASSTRDQEKLLGPVSRLWLPCADLDCLEISNPQPQAIEWRTVEYPWLRPSPEQMDALNGNVLTSLFGSLRRFLWQQHPDKLGQYPVGWTDQMLALGIHRAQEYGFTSEYAAGNFILLCLQFGFSWLDASPVKALLTRGGDRDQCMTDLLDNLPEQVWRTIEAKSQPQQDWLLALQQTSSIESLA